MKESINLRQRVLGVILSSSVFSLFLNTAVVSANPAGAGLGHSDGSGRTLGEDNQNTVVNEIASPGNSASVDGSKGSLQFAPGFLALDSVPDLHFMPSFTGAHQTSLMNNSRGGYTGTSFADGNSYGKLQVSDYRYSGEPYNPATSKPINVGWTLYAQLGYFSPIGGSGISGAVSSDPNYNDSGAASYGGTAPVTAPTTLGNNDWAIFLNNKKAVERNTSHGSNFRSNVFLSGAPMTDYLNGRDVEYDESSTLIAGGPQVKIWWTPKSLTNNFYGGFGKTVSYYDYSSTASLKVGNEAQEGQYYAPITWTLMASSR
ncbi:hypothetical protein [Xylocopilactobacillus apis]|uniref:WxL domain-containing protein n=1 Tax=Xylocopilactobacillus apis TaxID=2932183 RepID=A0AAU9CXZ0_9LACO|nr:hypothetical protein [Xylocopilactobacillus apis]BDR57291.1 hypothetical protein KIMC2_18530 [Xylocopilactobacillus apis]